MNPLSIIPSRSPVHGFIASSAAMVSCSRLGVSGGGFVSAAPWVTVGKKKAERERRTAERKPSAD
jgi:hypothetical protein